MIKVKSAYARPSPADGTRVLVERFWPEGLKTREAQVHEWLQELGASYDLQRFHFGKDDWDTYKNQYAEELLADRAKKKRLQELAEKARNGTVTLLYATRDAERNHASALKELIENQFLNQHVKRSGDA